MLRAASALVLAVAVGAGLAACESSDAAPAKAGDCLRSIETAAPSPSTFGGPQASPAPDLSLACLDGSGPVRLMKTGAPLVVNLWATYCAPCKEELPAVQKFAEAAAGKVGVVGVDSNDPASFGASYVKNHGLTFPMLSDPDAKLSAALATNYIPVTLFIGADGGLEHKYVSTEPLDEKTLAGLVDRYLGVQVDV